MGTDSKRFLSPELKEEIHQTLIDNIQPDENFCGQVMRKTSKTAPYTLINFIEFYLLNTNTMKIVKFYKMYMYLYILHRYAMIYKYHEQYL